MAYYTVTLSHPYKDDQWEETVRASSEEDAIEQAKDYGSFKITDPETIKFIEVVSVENMGHD